MALLGIQLRDETRRRISMLSNKRNSLKAAMVAAAIVIPAVMPAAEAKTKPNIVYILADDLGYGDLSCYGQEKFKTPNIDSLAKEGMKFTDHYSGSTVCAPSRCALMTGLHTGHAQVKNNREVQPEGQKAMRADTVTIPRLLKKAGYVSGMFGKWGLGAPGSDSDPAEHFDTFYGYNCQRQAHTFYPRHLWSNREKVELDGKTYSHDLIMKAALEFIRTNKDKPFFCYMPFTIPHAAMHAPKELHDKYRKLYPQFEKKIGRYSGPQVTNPIAAFPAMVEHMDNGVGQVLDLLRELKIEDNTLVIFTSDNGAHHEGGHDPRFWDSNGPLRGHKRDLYDGGIRAPFLARWSGTIAKGTTSNHISAFWDMMPTFCEIAGIETPGKIDGISMLPTLMGEKKNQRQHEYLYWQYGRKAVRLGKWKGVKGKGIELYDIEADIGETKNLSKENPDVVKRIAECMAEAVKDLE
jgi:arylsulfatase A-like enzyme